MSRLFDLTGKTALMRNKLQAMDTETMCFNIINLNSFSDAPSVQTILEQPLERKSGACKTFVFDIALLLSHARSAQPVLMREVTFHTCSVFALGRLSQMLRHDLASTCQHMQLAVCYECERCRVSLPA